MIVPSDWKVAKFGDLAKITCGVAATPEYVDAAIGVPFLSARNVQKERLDLSYFQHIPRELHKKLTKNTKPAKGDILLTRVGAGIGEAAVVDIDFEFSVYVSLTLIKCGKNIQSEYIKSLLNTNYYRYLATRDQFAGGGVQNLNVQMVKEYPILVPPLPEQKKIAIILSTWDQAISTTEQLLANSQQQKRALMQQLLTGKKRLLDENGVRFSGEWNHNTLGKIAQVYQPKTISQSDLTTAGYPVYGANGIIGFFSDFNHENEQIAVTCRGSTCGVVNWTKSKSWITGNAMVVNVDNNSEVDKKFIYYVLCGCNLTYLISGSGQPQITGNIKNHLINIPTLDEQQKIASVLTAADEGIATLQRKLDCLKQEKKALMQALLTGNRRVVLEAAHV